MTTATPTQLGMVGLGRMGANIVRRLMRDGHPCVVHDLSADAVASLASEGATGAGTIQEFVAALTPPRTVWVMVPAGAPTEHAVGSLADALATGDVVIDGGNTYYRDDLRRAAQLAERGIAYVDCGTSGGVFGLDRGFCLMVGCDDDAVWQMAIRHDSLAVGTIRIHGVNAAGVNLEDKETRSGGAGDSASIVLLDGFRHVAPVRWSDAKLVSA